MDDVSKKLLAGGGTGSKGQTAAGAAKKPPKGKPVTDGKCPYWGKHEPDRKLYQMYYNKLPCKSFPYTSKDGKTTAHKNATGWLEEKCKAKGWTPPQIKN